MSARQAARGEAQLTFLRLFFKSIQDRFPPVKAENWIGAGLLRIFYIGLFLLGLFIMYLRFTRT